MQKEGYRASTIESAISSLKAVARRGNLLDPESVKRYLATVKEASELVESGFDYVCDVEGYKVFRKRK